MVVAMLLATIPLSCGHKEESVTVKKSKADSLIEAAHKGHEYERLLELADTLQATGEISNIRADYWRGYAYSRQKMMRLSEKYWKRAINTEVKSDEDLTYYAKSANRLAGDLLLKGEYEATMKVATPALEKMREVNYKDNSDFAYLLAAVGCCQLKMGSPKEAAVNFDKSADLFYKVVESNPTRPNFTTAIVAVITITDNYLQLNRFESAFRWTVKFMELLDIYRSLPNADSNFIDKQQARLDIYHASALEGMGHHKEAEIVFSNALKSNYIQTSEGKLEAINYLLSAKLWEDASENFEVLDKQMQKYDMKASIEIIQHYLLPKYRANKSAQHTEETNKVSQQICDNLDSAIILYQRDAAMELTTIYNTQQKEKEIVEQRSRLTHQRYLAIVIVLVLVIISFILIIFFRHQASIRLRKAYAKLEIANERIKESSRMKTSFIQQMSHEIRTPLNILSGFTQIITTPGMELDEETRKDINSKIMDNTKRITELVNKMLELSDISSKTIIERNDDLPVLHIATQAINSVIAKGEAKIPIDTKIDESINQLTIKTNEQAVTHALLMLLDNAEHFTKEGSITLIINQQDDKVRFIVEDTGIGIPANEAEHIFEEFVHVAYAVVWAVMSCLIPITPQEHAL